MSVATEGENEDKFSSARAQFAEILDREHIEGEIQTHLSTHTELIPTFIQLHHGVFHNVVVEKPTIGRFEADYLYVTKHSEEVKIVLVELEHGAKRLMKRGGNYPVPTAELTAAIAQVQAWRRELENPTVRQDLCQRLSGLLWYAGTGPGRVRLTLEFLIVIGRYGDGRHADFASTLYSTDRIMVKTYDSILKEHLVTKPQKRALLLHKGGAFEIKNLDGWPEFICEALDPDELRLTPDQLRIFEKAPDVPPRWLGEKTDRIRPVNLGALSEFARNFKSL
ncbi:MAG: hypothetical protein JWP49_814 [Phenylobacterium sp.]|nr:hypothetical protein [Phenylobacterium sp.]